MNDLHNETQLRHMARADVYRLLSACFYEPEEAFVEEDIFGQLKTALTTLAPDRVDEAAAMNDAFRNVEAETLMLDYTRLFLGPFNILAKPYGSIYLDGETVVMGDSTIKVLDFYREGGFEIADDFREVPDHVALELEFLYLLTLRLSTDAEVASLKRRFLEEHLGQWVVEFADAMRNGAGTDFYKQLAHMTQRVVLEDLSELAATV